MCSFCLLPRRSSSRLSPAGSSSPAVLLTKKANAQLPLFRCLPLPCGARTQCWRIHVARLGVALLMASLGSTKSSGHVPLPSAFSPAGRWAEFAVRCDGCMQLECSGAGMGFLPPPSRPAPPQTFPCSPAALVSICYGAFWCDCFLIC